VARVSRLLAVGLPVRFVAALAALVLIAILFTVATREPERLRGYTELTLLPNNCLIDPARGENVAGCQVLGPRAYRIRFTKSINGSTAIASLGSCCPGSVGVSPESEFTVVLSLPRPVKGPTRASVLVP